MPFAGRGPIAAPRSRPVAPLAGLKPAFADRDDGYVRIVTLKPQEVTREIAEFLADPDVMEGWNAPRRTMSLEAFRAYAASFDNIKRNLMAIRLKDDGRPVGLIVLNIDHRHKTGAWHMCIGKAEDRGRRIGVCAGTLAVRHAFEDRKLEKLSFELLERNANAIAIVENYGLKLEGVLRQHRVDAVSGERLDQRVYGMTAQEYRTAVEALKPMLPPFQGPGLTPPAS